MFKKIDFDITATEADAVSRLTWLTERDMGLIDGELFPFAIKKYSGPVPGEPRSRFDMPSLTYDGIDVAKLGFVNKTGFALIMEGLPEQVENALKSRMRRMIRAAQAGMKIYREEKRILEKIVKKFFSAYCEDERLNDAHIHSLPMNYKYPDDIYNAIAGILPDEAETRIYDHKYGGGTALAKYLKNDVMDISEELISISFKNHYSDRIIVKSYARMSKDEIEKLLNDGRKVFLKTVNKDLIRGKLEQIPIDHEWGNNSDEIIKMKQLIAQNKVTPQGPFRFIKAPTQREILGILLHGDVAIGSVSSTQGYKVRPHGVTLAMLKGIPELENKLRTALKMSLGVFNEPEVVIDKDEQQRMWLENMEAAVRDTDVGYDI